MNGCVLCGADKVKARRLCIPCYRLVRYRKLLSNYPRIGRTGATARGNLLAEYEHLRSYGYAPRQIATRLGMSMAAFERAMYRARKAGDPRAQSFRGMAA